MTPRSAFAASFIIRLLVWLRFGRRSRPGAGRRVQRQASLRRLGAPSDEKPSLAMRKTSERIR
jgi:hypothetical protein